MAPYDWFAVGLAFRDYQSAVPIGNWFQKYHTGLDESILWGYCFSQWQSALSGEECAAIPDRTDIYPRENLNM